MGVQLTILCKLSIFRLNVCCSLSRKIIVMTIPLAAYLVLKQSGARAVWSPGPTDGPLFGEAFILKYLEQVVQG